MRRNWHLVLLLTSVLFVAGCNAATPDPVTIRVGVLPILDSLPMFVAEERGYFDAQGITVELIPVSSAPERDQLMQAGQIDGMVNELVSTLYYNQEGTEIIIVRFARVATEDSPLFRILAAKDSGIENPEDLVGIPIGISDGTVIEYTTDRMLTNAGLSQDQIAKIAVPKISDRYALLEANELMAANLPDPLASLAIQGGATLIIDDSSYPEIGVSVLSFNADFVHQHPDALRKFLIAIETAVENLNSDKEQWGTLLTEHNLVPPPLLGTYNIPDYPTASVPSLSQFADALDWAMEKGLIEGEVSYSESVDGSYLP
jgi:NitT/TauT family transport system substrate-binding protein